MGLVICTAVLPVWILQPIFNEKVAEVRALGVLRSLRLVRVVRLIRTWSLFRILWTLIRGITDSWRTLLWTWVMVPTVLFTIGVFCVHFIAWSDTFRDDEVVQMYFGTISDCFLTLFQFTTLDSWHHPGRLVMKKSVGAGLMLIAA